MYTAGFNMPGYLPESDVAEFETFDEAKRYIISEILYHEDCVAEQDEDLATELSHLAQDVNLESGPFTTPDVGNLVYWVAMIEQRPDLKVVDRETYAAYVRANEHDTAVNEGFTVAQMLSFNEQGVRIASATYYKGGYKKYKILAD